MAGHSTSALRGLQVQAFDQVCTEFNGFVERLERLSPPFAEGPSHWRKRPTSSLSRYPKTVCGSAVTALRKMIQTRSFHRPALYVAIACASSALIGRAARLKDYGRPTPSRRELSPALLVSRSIRRPVGHQSVTSPSPRIHCSTGRLGHVVRPASCVPDIFAGAYLRCRPVTHLSAIDANGSLERGLGFEHCPTVTLNDLWRWPAPLAVC